MIVEITGYLIFIGLSFNNNDDACNMYIIPYISMVTNQNRLTAVFRFFLFDKFEGLEAYSPGFCTKKLT